MYCCTCSLQSSTLNGKDWGWAFALWALMLAIRAAGIALLYPLCSRLGYGGFGPQGRLRVLKAELAEGIRSFQQVLVSRARLHC